MGDSCYCVCDMVYTGAESEMKIISALIMLIFLNGCAHISEDRSTLYGWGKAKMDEKGNVLELEANSPIKDIFSLNAIKD